MGARGPASKPIELKALEGNRGHRPLNLDATFRPEVGLPTVPKDLTPGARKVWKRLAAELLRYNLMSVVYSDTFEDLCETVATVKLLRRSINARMAVLRAVDKDVSEAFEVKTPNGMPVQAPVYQTLKTERAHMHNVLAKFGLAPSEQARVTTAVRAQLKLFEGSGTPAEPTPATPGNAPPRGFADF
jgi:P27 family predicted phage terminase small subunit